MSYIVDRVSFNTSDSEDDLHFQLQEYLNDKHKHSVPWEVVNIVSIEKLYASSADLTQGKVTAINVTILWRTHR